jgi:hypothetical protein
MLSLTKGPYWKWNQPLIAPPEIARLPPGQLTVRPFAYELVALLVCVTISYSLSPGAPCAPAAP